MKAINIVRLFWLFVFGLIIALALGIMAIINHKNMSVELAQVQDSLKSQRQEMARRDTLSRQRDIGLWESFSFKSAVLPDIYVCVGETLNFGANELMRQRVDFELRDLFLQREKLSLWWQRQGLYRPIIQAELAEVHLHNQFWLLTVVESGLDPTVRSPASALGLAQIMYATGRQYGLTKDFFRDERKDPWESARVAAKYLVDLPRFRWLKGENGDGYGNAWLTLAAYNAGPGRLNQAMRIERTHDFWALKTLRRETRRYVPRFIALCYIFDHPEILGFDLLPPYNPLPEVKDTVVVLPTAGALADLAAAAKIELDDFMLINTDIEIVSLPAGKYRVKTIVSDPN